MLNSVRSLLVYLLLLGLVFVSGCEWARLEVAPPSGAEWQCGEMLLDTVMLSGEFTEISYRTRWVDQDGGNDRSKNGQCWMQDLLIHPLGAVTIDTITSVSCTDSEVNFYYFGFNDLRTNICPEGWHVPSDAEWLTLESALGLGPECLYKDTLFQGRGGGPNGAFFSNLLLVFGQDGVMPNAGLVRFDRELMDCNSVNVATSTISDGKQFIRRIRSNPGTASNLNGIQRSRKIPDTDRHCVYCVQDNL